MDDQKQVGTVALKRGLAQMLKGGVIMDVVNAEQARIAEDAGACAGLHEDLVPARGQLTHRAGYEPDSELIAFDLSRNADAHDVLRFQDGFA